MSAACIKKKPQHFSKESHEGTVDTKAVGLVTTAIIKLLSRVT